LPLDEYFAAAGTYEHLLNISIFFQHTGLPGVFWGGPVNGTIWTLPIEFACYILVPFLAAFGLLRRGLILVVLALVATAYGWTVWAQLSWVNQGGTLGSGLPVYSTIKNGLFFVIGAAMWVHRADIPLNAPLALCCLGFMAVASTGSAKPVALYLGLPYLTMYLSLHRYWGIDVHRLGGDLSYGTYLYGWPVQMMVLTIFGNQIGVLNFAALSLVLSLALAAMSWRYVERPALRLKLSSAARSLANSG
jgi:peptidoglycan/LPS O-acetylase OafA/YrhL